MGPAPIPPHERSWRHPSELAPTLPSLDEPGKSGSRWTMLVASGAVAVTIVAVLAVTVVPRRAASPVAMSATTLPPYSVAPAAAVQRPATADSFEQVRLEQSSLSAASGLALTGSPRMVAAPLDQVAPSDQSAQPNDDQRVHVLTTSHVYHLTWGDLSRVIAPDDSIVIDDDGQVLGTFVDGRFVAD